MQAKEFAQLQVRLEEMEDKLMAWHRANECSRRLAQIPGVGPIGASMLMMKARAPEAFRSARHFAAWLGLTPKDHSTAGKVRLGVITRAGNEALRSVRWWWAPPPSFSKLVTAAGPPRRGWSRGDVTLTEYSH